MSNDQKMGEEKVSPRAKGIQLVQYPMNNSGDIINQGKSTPFNFDESPTETSKGTRGGGFKQSRNLSEFTQKKSPYNQIKFVQSEKNSSHILKIPMTDANQSLRDQQKYLYKQN